MDGRTEKCKCEFSFASFRLNRRRMHFYFDSWLHFDCLALALALARLVLVALWPSSSSSSWSSSLCRTPRAPLVKVIALKPRGPAVRGAKCKGPRVPSKAHFAWATHRGFTFVRCSRLVVVVVVVVVVARPPGWLACCLALPCLACLPPRLPGHSHAAMLQIESPSIDGRRCCPNRRRFYTFGFFRVVMLRCTVQWSALHNISTNPIAMRMRPKRNETNGRTMEKISG